MDDIDDLLDEVESKYCQNETSNETRTKAIKKEKQISVKRPSTSSREDSLEDIINDIISDEGYEQSLPKSKNKSNINNPITTTTPTIKAPSETCKAKCYTIYVAGADKKPGYSSSSQQNPCDQLHCTSCDNKIIIFDGYKWNDNSCDYLVFRNNYPDFVRLKSVLMTRPGYRAYCCQCSWLSAKGLLELRTFKPSFKWICRKH